MPSQPKKNQNEISQKTEIEAKNNTGLYQTKGASG